jgi:hypothetical protein
MVLFYIAWFDLLCIAVVQRSGSAGWSREPQLDGCTASGSWCHDALRPAALWLAVRDAGNAWYTASAPSQGPFYLWSGKAERAAIRPIYIRSYIR